MWDPQRLGPHVSDPRPSNFTRSAIQEHRASGFSPRNLMSHVSPAVVVSWPATSSVRMLSLSCASVSLSASRSPPPPPPSSSSAAAPSLACFRSSVWRKSLRTSPPSLLLAITESSIAYIRFLAFSTDQTILISEIIHLLVTDHAGHGEMQFLGS
uniref:Uncharacterized protein n=1 Tax=Oryza glumipatula TaxID=40148 RepID=A0A0D9ZFG6_9ORYZ